MLAFPLAWIGFKLGGNPEFAYWTLAAVTLVVFIERIAFAGAQTGLPFRKVLTDAFAGSALASVAAAIVPLLIFFLLEPGTARTVWVVLSSFASTAIAAFLLGATKGEREAIISSVRNHFHQA